MLYVVTSVAPPSVKLMVGGPPLGGIQSAGRSSAGMMCTGCDADTMEGSGFRALTSTSGLAKE